MAGIKEEKKIYLVGIYCRLSKDDGTDNESASIATQKSILTDYVKKQGWHIAKTYVDERAIIVASRENLVISRVSELATFSFFVKGQAQFI